MDYFVYVGPDLDLTDEYKCPSTQQPGLNMQRMVTFEGDQSACRALDTLI